MSSGRSKINRKSEAAIAALLTEPTHAAAALKAGVSEATLARWLKEPTFAAAYRTARRALVESAIGYLQSATSEAVEVLRRNLSAAKSTDQIRAAVAIIDRSVHALEWTDLLHRMDELEQLMSAPATDTTTGSTIPSEGKRDE